MVALSKRRFFHSMPTSKAPRAFRPRMLPAGQAAGRAGSN